jgi:thiosulfate/3-mercaptopyruvate sulfurtransferase
VLKRGHLPGAINIPDAANWIDEQSKDIRTYEGLQRLYRGLDPAKAVIPYCHSGRRASFAYFILRLMGFSDVRLYERSWNEWGQSGLYFPIQSAMQRPAGNDLPQAQKTMAPAASPTRPGPKEQPASGGYVSCGG